MGTQTAVAPKGSPTGQPAAAPNAFVQMTPIVFIFAVVYFLIIRPNQKQAKQHRELVDSLKNGDRVVTQGGIHGTVISLKGSIVQVKIAENVRVDVNRSAISQVVQDVTNGNIAPVTGGKPE